MRLMMLPAVAALIGVGVIPVAGQTLAVSVTGPGKVTGTGIDCPSDCTEAFLPTSIRMPGRPSPPAPTIVLTAAPAAGYQLSSVRWTGSCQEGLERPTCTVALSGGTAVSVTIAIVPARLTVEFNTEANPGGPDAIGPGAVTSIPSGIECRKEDLASPGVGTCSGEFQGTVTLSAVATSPDWAFLSWMFVEGPSGGHCPGAAATCPLEMTGPRVVRAFFGPHRINVKVVLTEGGRVREDVPAPVQRSLDCPEDCEANVLGRSDRNELTLIALPSPGYVFRGWMHVEKNNPQGSLSCSGENPTCVLKGSVNPQTVAAVFLPPP
jgi:hypothetical protein